MILDYETLKVIWWLLIGALLIGFVVTDGFDMGAAALLPFLGRTDEERRVILKTLGPQWNGSHVWFIAAIGATFAAWPAIYGAALSGLYIALLLLFVALFFRPVGFDYRGKIEDPRWRRSWDWVLFASGAVPALIFGVLFGNLLLGMPFHYDDFMRAHYAGTFWYLLNPFGLLCGVVSLSMLVMHGAVWLQLRAAEPIESRARTAVKIAGIVLIAVFAAAGLWVAYGINGDHIKSITDMAGAPDPTAKTVVAATGDWLANYGHYPWMLSAPIAGFAGAILTVILSAARRPGWAFLTSALALAGVVLTAGFSMFPFILPSSVNPSNSLTVWDATSSPLALTVMLWAAVIFIPIILAYTTWTYRAMWGKATVRQIQEKTRSAF